MTKLVKQEKCGDCGPACLAMVLGCSLAEAREKLGFDVSNGVGASDMIRCLIDNGVPAVDSRVWPSTSVPAIFTVPSLNHPGLLHYIYWDGEQFLDPTHEELRYPWNGPVVNNKTLLPQWDSAILLWL